MNPPTRYSKHRRRIRQCEVWACVWMALPIPILPAFKWYHEIRENCRRQKRKDERNENRKSIWYEATPDRHAGHSSFKETKGGYSERNGNHRAK